METYDVIVVQVSTDEVVDREARIDEVERYMYGRFFRLGDRINATEVMPRPGRNYVDLFYLVESRYTHQIIPRLASGLLYAHVANEQERYEVGL